jgi:hypothetical protein
MRYIAPQDRYAQLPRPDWIGFGWSSTRRAACACPLTGTIIELRRGQVRVEWGPCSEHPGAPFPPSWEPVDRGTPVKPAPSANPAPDHSLTLRRRLRRGARRPRLRLRLRLRLRS